MKYRFTLLLTAVFPILAFSQTFSSADSAEQWSICNKRTYTKVQTLPSFKISKQVFSDSITAYLITNGVSLKNGIVNLKFILDCYSQITEVEIFTDISHKEAFVAALQNFSNLLLPARQGNYNVKYYTNVALKFEDHKLSDVMFR